MDNVFVEAISNLFEGTFKGIKSKNPILAIIGVISLAIFLPLIGIAIYLIFTNNITIKDFYQILFN